MLLPRSLEYQWRPGRGHLPPGMGTTHATHTHAHTRHQKGMSPAVCAGAPETMSPAECWIRPAGPRPATVMPRIWTTHARPALLPGSRRAPPCGLCGESGEAGERFGGRASSQRTRRAHAARSPAAEARLPQRRGAHLRLTCTSQSSASAFEPCVTAPGGSWMATGTEDTVSTGVSSRKVKGWGHRKVQK